MFKRILVPIDGSKHSLEALEVAKEIGRKFQSKIYIYSVAQIVRGIDPVPDSYTIRDQVPKGIVENTKKFLEEAKSKADDYEYKVYAEYELGRPSELILKYADEKDIDLIVMNNRGLGAFSRTLLGSVSHKVLNATKRSVLLVK